MINLLPVEEKKRIATEYHFRIFTFYLYVAGFCFLIGIIGVLPAYLLSSIKENLAEIKWENLKNLPQPKPNQETKNAVKDINFKVSKIEITEKAKFLVLENAFDKVLFDKMSDIKITSINYKKDEAGLKTISLQGIAPNRERLLLFRQMLEADKSFSKVELPISNFVKGANIDFSLDLTSA